MIKGHGIDIESIAAIEKAYQKNTRFAEKVLTEAERERFEELSGKRKMEYLTGRWSAKEAFSKAMGTGIGPVGFQELEILNDAHGAPYFSKSPFSSRLSITSIICLATFTTSSSNDSFNVSAISLLLSKSSFIFNNVCNV